VDGALDRLDALLRGLSVEETDELDELIREELQKPWLPTPGPQLEAFLSEADLLLYGGAAGGGKTDLLCGLALTEHNRTVIFRRQSNDLDGFWERLGQLCGTPRHKDTNKKKLTTQDGRLVECGHLDAPGAEKSWQGRPHDLIAFDEGAQLSAYKVNFVLGWLRSADGRRCRAVIASNPPIGGEGSWLIEWFAPWLDPMFPKPSKYGELRWAVASGTAAEIKTHWVDGPEPVIIENGVVTRLATADEISASPPLDNLHIPLSRTFIPSKLEDNPYLRETSYRAQINSMPEPLRSQLLLGDFLAGRMDDEWQVIPSEWVRAAQEAWPGRPKTTMKSLGVDVAQGGADNTTLAALHDGPDGDPTHFDEVDKSEGKDTPNGPVVAGLILKKRRDGAAIGIDTTGGWGGSARDHLATHNNITAIPIVFSSSGEGMDPGTKLEYFNLRAKMYWEFRIALDPDNGSEIILPPGARILAQLTAPRWKPKSGKILIESKEDIRKRLGSSTDEADAIVIAWYIRNRAMKMPKGSIKPRTSIPPSSTSWMT